MRLDHQIIYELIQPNSRLLDLGCGEGELLQLLQKKNVLSQGIEINYELVKRSIQKGLNTVQLDLDKDLMNYQNQSFDYVVLNKTLQATHKPLEVLKAAVRIGNKVLVSFNNFAFWEVRAQLFFKGSMPKNADLPFEWYDTPNIHLVTISDFDKFCAKQGFEIEQKIFYNEKKVIRGLKGAMANIFSPYALYVLKQK
jgi:methionine biosynthesis protein MetW